MIDRVIGEERELFRHTTTRVLEEPTNPVARWNSRDAPERAVVTTTVSARLTRAEIVSLLTLTLHDLVEGSAAYGGERVDDLMVGSIGLTAAPK